MREILFKAKRLDNKEWVHGSLVVFDENQMFIMPTCEYASSLSYTELFQLTAVMVDPSTVCQYTGLTDKNGVKIFEGDILKIAKVVDGFGGYYHPQLEYPVDVIVKYDLCAYTWETVENPKYYMSFPEAWCHYECTVIGNIHDKEDKA